MVCFSNDSIKSSNRLGPCSQPRIHRIRQVFSVFGHGFSDFGHNFLHTRPVSGYSSLFSKFFELQQNSISTMDASKPSDEIILNSSGPDLNSIKVSDLSIMPIVSSISTLDQHLTSFHEIQPNSTVNSLNTQQGLSQKMSKNPLSALNVIENCLMGNKSPTETTFRSQVNSHPHSAACG